MNKSIAIIGSGIICAIGTNKETVRKALVHQQSGIQGIKYLPSCHQDLMVGEVKLSNEELKLALQVPTTQVESRTALLGAFALRQALQEAAISMEELKSKRVCFISGTTVGGMDMTERFYESMMSEDHLLGNLDAHDCGSSSQAIARLAGLKAEICTISTACSSALNAIILGSRMLLNGEVDIVIAGGSEALTLFHLNGFNSLMILDHEPCKPFDKHRAGLNLGEGAAYVVLKCSDKSDSRPPMTYIAGFGNRCDAFHQTASSKNGEGAFLAMSDALAMAGVSATQVDYINAHGTGTLNNDSSESAALKRIFIDRMPPVSSTKSFTGHTTSASGAIETVISIIAMQHHFIPANLHWTQNDETCILPSCGVASASLNYVLCNSFGFGGNDSSLLLSYDEPPLQTIPQEVETMVLTEYELHDIEELSNLKQFVSPIEQRRMDVLTKASIYTSFKALSMAGITVPDAIIVATAKGMMLNSEKILKGILTAGEDSVSPTLFMQSTHNTLAGIMATRLKCHGYNITYTQGTDSLKWAVADAHKLITEGKAEVVLVGYHDECTEQMASFLKRAGKQIPPRVFSKSQVIVKRKNEV